MKRIYSIFRPFEIGAAIVTSAAIAGLITPIFIAPLHQTSSEAAVNTTVEAPGNSRQKIADRLMMMDAIEADFEHGILSGPLPDKPRRLLLDGLSRLNFGRSVTDTDQVRLQSSARTSSKAVPAIPAMLRKISPSRLPLAERVCYLIKSDKSDFFLIDKNHFSIKSTDLKLASDSGVTQTESLKYRGEKLLTGSIEMERTGFPNQVSSRRPDEVNTGSIALPKPRPTRIIQNIAYSRRKSKPIIAVAGKAKPPRDEHRCMAEALYFEARSEPPSGQLAVAQVILNRARSRSFPNSICGVVYQNENRRNACQFSFACDGLSEQPKNSTAWQVANVVARQVLTGKAVSSAIGPRAVHYHATYVWPRWARSMIPVSHIGQHIFYERPQRRSRIQTNLLHSHSPDARKILNVPRSSVASVKFH